MAGMVFLGIIAILKKAIMVNVFVEIGITVAVSGICYIGMLFLFRILTIAETKEVYRRVFK